MEKIIGTGLSGLVGSRIVDLLNQDHTFVDFSLNTGVDILNFRQLEDAFEENKDAKAVIHLAAFTDTNAAWSQRGDKGGLCYELNVNGTFNIVDLCQRYGKYLIYISTDFVFDGNKEEAYTEDDTPNPIEWYGQTKYEGEKLVTASGLPASIVRIAFPYRAEFEPKTDIVRKILAKLQNGEEVKMFDDQITTPTFIDDIALGLGSILKKRSTGIYHLVGSSSQSPYDMALSVARTFRQNEKLVTRSSLGEYTASQPTGSRPWQKSLRISNQKVMDMGIPLRTLREGLEEIKKQQAQK